MILFCTKQLTCLLCAALVWAGAVESARAEGRHRDHPGFIDGSLLAELASEDGDLVEVSLYGPLLRQVARAIGKSNEPLGKFLKQIVSISAVVIEKPTDSGMAKKRMKTLALRMEDERWERLGRVRDGGSDVWIYVLNDEDGEMLDGLTVLINESDGGELVFVNLAGHIDLELIGELSGAIGIPGLDMLDSAEWNEDSVGKGRGKSRGRSGRSRSHHDQGGDR